MIGTKIMENMIGCKCGSKQFGYTDDVNIVFLCYKCGRYKGNMIDKEFSELLNNDPLVLLSMIKEKYLVPLK